MSNYYSLKIDLFFHRSARDTKVELCISSFFRNKPTLVIHIHRLKTRMEENAAQDIEFQRDGEKVKEAGKGNEAGKDSVTSTCALLIQYYLARKARKKEEPTIDQLLERYRNEFSTKLEHSAELQATTSSNLSSSLTLFGGAERRGGADGGVSHPQSATSAATGGSRPRIGSRDQHDTFLEVFGKLNRERRLRQNLDYENLNFILPLSVEVDYINLHLKCFFIPLSVDYVINLHLKSKW